MRLLHPDLPRSGRGPGEDRRVDGNVAGQRRLNAPILQLLRAPDPENAPTLADWDLVVRQGKRAGVLARLTEILDAAGTLQQVPEAPRRHLVSARTVVRRQHQAARWEIGQIAKALGSKGVPTILLKGAAYLAAGLPCARGRMFVDIDVMVSADVLSDAEKALNRHGWIPERLDPYDKRYYREWMHEIPPLRHIKRGSVLDVHHTILPPTSKPKPDARKLLAAAVPVEGFEEIYVLAPTDMVLHSATHLFYDGELSHGLRDLVDLDDLVRHFSAQDSGFWQALVDRAFEMELAQPLFYGLRYSQRFLGTPAPEFVQKAVERAGPSPVMRPVMDALFDRALMPDHSTCSDWFTAAARWLLYVRAHYLRMPLRLLIPHLARKAWRRVKGEETH